MNWRTITAAGPRQSAVTDGRLRSGPFCVLRSTGDRFSTASQGRWPSGTYSGAHVPSLSRRGNRRDARARDTSMLAAYPPEQRNTPRRRRAASRKCQRCHLQASVIPALRHDGPSSSAVRAGGDTEDAARRWRSKSGGETRRASIHACNLSMVRWRIRKDTAQFR
jgi:hypothetical protein